MFLFLPFFPSEMDEETMKSYQVALRTGKGSMPHMRVFICGSGRVGKTCLVNSLLDLPFNERSESTIGVKLDKAACSLEQNGSRWTWRREQSEEKQHELLAAKMLVEEMKRKALEKHQTAPDRATSTQTNHLNCKVKQSSKSAEQGTGLLKAPAQELRTDEVNYISPIIASRRAQTTSTFATCPMLLT